MKPYIITLILIFLAKLALTAMSTQIHSTAVLNAISILDIGLIVTMMALLFAGLRKALNRERKS